MVGLTLASTASPATVTIQIGSLAVVSGSVTGTISGFQPNATVTVNGSSYLANATGVVSLSGAPLAGSAELTVGFLDSNGVSQTVSTGLKDLTTGVTLSAASLGDLVPDTTAPVTLTLNTSGGTTTTTTTTAGTTTSGGGNGGANSPAGARKLADGSVSIPASSVVMPYRLVIKQFVFKQGMIRAHNQPVSIGYRVADTRGNWVRDAAVWMRSLPLGRLSSVKAKRTTASGWVSFTLRSGKSVKLVKGGRVNVFVRAWTPGQTLIGGTSTRRLVSLRVSTHR